MCTNEISNKLIISWSSLPAALLVSIAERLNTCIDVKRFRAVCSSWRFCIPHPSRNSPPLLPSLGCDSFKLSLNIIYRLQEDKASSEWLVRVQETETGKIQIQHQFGISKISEFPPQSSSKILNLLNFKVTEITKIYALDQIINTSNSPVSIDWKHKTHRVVLSSKSVSNLNDYAILAVNKLGNLYYMKSGDATWRVLSNEEIIPRNFLACDIVDHRGKFYAIDKKGFVLVLSYSFELISTIELPASDEQSVGFWENNPHFLVSSGEELHLIRRKDQESYGYYNMNENYRVAENSTNDPFRVKVYKLYEQQLKWVEVRSLRNNSFFLCRDCSFAVSSPEFTGFDRGFIYFLDENYSLYFVNVFFGVQKMPLWGFNLETGKYKRFLDHKLF